MNHAQLIYENYKDLFDPNVLHKIAAITNRIERDLAFDRYFALVAGDRHEARQDLIKDQGQDLATVITETRATIAGALRRMTEAMIDDVRQGRQDWDQLRDLLEDHPEIREEVENYL